MSKHPVVRPSRIKWTQWGTWILAAVTLALVLYLVEGRSSDHQAQADLRAHLTRSDSRIEALSTGLAQEQAHSERQGVKPVVPPAASIAAGKATPPPTDIVPVTPGVTRTVTVGPTAAQVRAGVNAYFADNPVKVKVDPATLAPQVTAFVTKYLREHPPAAGKNGTDGLAGATGKPGPPPTDAQVAAAVLAYLPSAVADYLTANPPPTGPVGPVGPTGPACDPQTNPLCRGPIGPSGSPGPGPTADQIKTAVADYLTDNPPPPCPTGYTAKDKNITTDTGPVTARVCVKNDADTPPTDTPPS